LTGDRFLDTSAFRITFNVQTNLAQPLRPIGGPWGFFRRARVLAAGQLAEDIDQHNRIHQIMRVLAASESRGNGMAEAFGHEFEWGHYSNNKDKAGKLYPRIAGSDCKTVFFKPLSGSIKQNKFIPLRCCPITIELELVDSASAPLIVPDNTQTRADTTITSSTNITDWEINDAQMRRRHLRQRLTQQSRATFALW
jgi:hypothetical protein